VVPESLRLAIQSSYSLLLEKQGFKARSGQRQMIAAISRSLCDAETNGLSLMEAGTGVGKSVAYLIPSINIALGKNKKLVISTATAALQDQLVNQDLPNIKEVLGKPFSYGLVKGRKRYLCQANLDKSLHGGTSGMAVVDYFEGGQALGQESLKLFTTLESARTSDQWDGDRDHWPDTINDNDWNLITSDRHSCMGGRCPFFSNCSFYEARESVEELDALVVNHDLLLADLMLGGGVILPAPEDSIYVLDEAHHLIEKTRNHLSARMNTGASAGAVGEIINALSKMSEHFHASLDSGALATLILGLRSQAEQFLTAIGQLEVAAEPVSENKPDQIVRFEQGKVPEALLVSSLAALPTSRKIRTSLEQLSHEMEKLADSDSSDSKEVGQSWFPLVGEWLHRAESWHELLSRYANPDSDEQYFARWIRRNTRGGGFDFFAAPIDISTQLGELLWHRAAGAVLTSATLSVKGNFNRLLTQLGLPESTLSESIQSPFDYANIASLELCVDAPDPRNEFEYDQYVTGLLERAIEADKGALVKGTLVLFSSNRQMERVYEKFEAEWKSQILMQGLIPRMEIVRRHKSKIDEGKGSVIFGLRSFAEGIDLPGDYCTHLFITRIPFSVPDDPIEATISERISAGGGNSFRELSLPNAAIRLIQSVGRLIRSETDSGTVTITDPRLKNSSYSRYLLSALPPFRVVERRD
jgi:ATP-dependent DNA helicase DinG